MQISAEMWVHISECEWPLQLGGWWQIWESGQRKGRKKFCSFCLYSCAKQNWDHRGCCRLGLFRGVQSIPSAMSPCWCQRRNAQASHVFCSGKLKLGTLRWWNYISLDDREMLLRANYTGIIFGYQVIMRKKSTTLLKFQQQIKSLDKFCHFIRMIRMPIKLLTALSAQGSLAFFQYFISLKICVSGRH